MLSFHVKAASAQAVNKSTWTPVACKAQEVQSDREITLPKKIALNNPRDLPLFLECKHLSQDEN